MLIEPVVFPCRATLLPDVLSLTPQPLIFSAITRKHVNRTYGASLSGYFLPRSSQDFDLPMTSGQRNSFSFGIPVSMPTKAAVLLLWVALLPDVLPRPSQGFTATGIRRQHVDASSDLPCLVVRIAANSATAFSIACSVA
jgi:hypothetical protein